MGRHGKLLFILCVVLPHTRRSNQNSAQRDTDHSTGHDTELPQKPSTHTVTIPIPNDCDNDDKMWERPRYLGQFYYERKAMGKKEKSVLSQDYN